MMAEWFLGTLKAVVVIDMVWALAVWAEWICLRGWRSS